MRRNQLRGPPTKRREIDSQGAGGSHGLHGSWQENSITVSHFSKLGLPQGDNRYIIGISISGTRPSGSADMQIATSINEQFDNPGYEYLKLLYLIKEEQRSANTPSDLLYFPLLALQSACLAIQGYIDQVGQQIDPAWDEFDQEVASITESIARIFEKTDKLDEFKKGIWKDVQTLFDIAERIRENSAELKKTCMTEAPEAYREIAAKYPIHLSQAIAEEAVEALLTCAKSRAP